MTIRVLQWLLRVKRWRQFPESSGSLPLREGRLEQELMRRIRKPSQAHSKSQQSAVAAAPSSTTNHRHAGPCLPRGATKLKALTASTASAVPFPRTRFEQHCLTIPCPVPVSRRMQRRLEVRNGAMATQVNISWQLLLTKRSARSPIATQVESRTPLASKGRSISDFCGVTTGRTAQRSHLTTAARKHSGSPDTCGHRSLAA